MGFVATVVFNVDLLHCVKDDAEFGKKVYQTIMSVNNSDRDEIAIHSGMGCAATAVQCHHAAVGMPLIVGGGNFFTKIDNVYLSERGDLEMQLLIKLAEKHGFNLHRKRKAK